VVYIYITFIGMVMADLGWPIEGWSIELCFCIVFVCGLPSTERLSCVMFGCKLILCVLLMISYHIGPEVLFKTYVAMKFVVYDDDDDDDIIIISQTFAMAPINQSSSAPYVTNAI